MPRSVCATVFFLLVLLLTDLQAVSQQPSASPSQQWSLGERARALAAAQQVATPTPTPAQTGRSLADVARGMQDNKKRDIQVNEDDKKELFASLKKVLNFASEDSGYAKQGEVKHQLVSEDDVVHYMSEVLANSTVAQRARREEMVLKKFGFLPPGFNLSTFSVKAAGRSIAGFYDPKTKTMNLLNWIDMEQQYPIMAHELTHALQDQNYNLMQWSQYNKSMKQALAPTMRVTRDTSQEASARKAVIEGQAMVVYYDWLLKPHDTSLVDPFAIEFIRDRMSESYDTAVEIRNAPLLLKDASIFPYREGFIFELALLKKGGTPMAFAGAFARPPVDTHQILDPDAYLADERVPGVMLPDLTPFLANKYDPYDSGSMGQLDVRIMVKEYGNDNDVDVVVPYWEGGSYVAVKRASATRDAQVSTADLGLIYVSRWKNAKAARRFVRVYERSLLKRLTVTDPTLITSDCVGSAGRCGPTRVNTSEGPVVMEILPNNIVFIAHSFDDDTVSRLRRAVLVRNPQVKEPVAEAELSMRLFEIPAFQAIQEQVLQNLLTQSYRKAH